MPRFRNLPVTLRVPLVMAGLMILLGFLASQSVLSALGRVQDARLSETARLHVEGLSVALGPSVLRQDVWEVYDILDRARSAYDGQRLLLSIVADERGRILAATDPRRAPVGEEVAGFEAGAVPPDAVRMTGDPVLRVAAPLLFQGRQIGQIVTELDVTDLLAERRNVSIWLLFGNAAATALLAFGGWLAVARILRPVGALVSAMDDSKGAPRPIAETDIPRGDPGLSRLISTYNRMTTAVESRAEAERRLAERERFVSLGRLIQCAFDGLVEARWTDDIHAEWIRNLAANSMDTPISRFEATRDRMKAVLPDADVVGYETLIPGLSLPDLDDRHVLAAAIVGKASVIVTWNLKDFPAAALRPHGITCVSPDEFLIRLHALAPEALIASIRRARQNLRKTIPSAEEFLAAIERQGLMGLSAIFAGKTRRLI
ncbi:MULTISPECIES: PIN domain-containing protein [Paracoccaceae]|nr:MULTISPECIES: PIN domain-containing protein [Paracoccaceae]